MRIIYNNKIRRVKNIVVCRWKDDGCYMHGCDNPIQYILDTGTRICPADKFVILEDKDENNL